jgi:outer membrane immunogenic protein
MLSLEFGRVWPFCNKYWSTPVLLLWEFNAFLSGAFVMKKFLLVAFAGAALLPVSALAADMGAPVYKAPPPPPPAPVYNWTGCFVGAGGGYGMNNVDSWGYASDPYETVPFNEGTTGGRGWLGQLSAGCDYQFSTGNFGNWVVGVFGDYEFMDLTGNHIGPTGSVEDDTVANLKENSAWAVGARIGYLITPNFLTYWDGGYTQTHFDQANYSFAAPDFASANLALPGTTYDGWFLGSGFEYSFNWLVPGLFLKTEYRFSSYGAKTLADIDKPTEFTFSENLHPYVQTVTTQLVYRFNWLGH